MEKKYLYFQPEYVGKFKCDSSKCNNNCCERNWEIDIDALRQEVQTRQYQTDANGNFIRDEKGQLVNKLTQPYEGDPSVTLYQYLYREIEEYEKLHRESLQ